MLLIIHKIYEICFGVIFEFQFYFRIFSVSTYYFYISKFFKKTKALVK